MENHKNMFYQNLSEYYVKNKDARKPWTCEELKQIAIEILNAKQTKGKKSRRQYHLLSLYDTMEVGHKSVVTKKRLENNDNIIYVTPYEDLFQILYSAHISVGHGARDKMIFTLKTKYQIPRPVLEICIQSCEICHKKRNRKHANLVTKPIVSKEFCSRGQVDLIDYQSCQDGEYKWILNYQDHLTKFICLRPLKSKKAVEVALELLKIFLEFGSPAILQSDNGREFTNCIIVELVKLWPKMKIIHGRPRHPQSQGSIERSNQDVENMLRAWMQDNNSTNWSVGCYFVQFQKNCSFHRIIGRSPYKALFGTDPKIGLSSTNLPNDIIKSLETEDDLNELISKLESRPEEMNSSNVVLPEHTNNHIPESEQQERIIAEEKTTEIYTLVEESNIIIEVEDVGTEDYDLNDIATIPGNEHENNQNVEGALDQQIICHNCENQNGAACVLCSIQTSILTSRKECSVGQKRAAKKMLTNTAKKLPPLKIGDCVLLSVDKIDRGPSDLQNIMCVITDYKNGVYQLGTSVGKIKGWYNRSDVNAAENKFLNIEDIPEKHVTVREAVAGMSLRDGQGYFKCSCKPSKKQCQTNRCVCFKKKVKCNSRCHSSATCLNKKI